MQNHTIENVNNFTCNAKSKDDWHKPSLVRIDIKRTLTGVGSASDGFDPTT